MKKLLAAAALFTLIVAPAVAADMPVAAKAPPRVMPVPVYSWTGCYIGVEGGGAWGRSRHISGDPGLVGVDITNNYNVSGWLVGGEAGCNYQTDRWVFGVEGDWSWTDKRGSANNIAPFNTTSISGTKEKWIATARGRVGFLPTEMLLLYVTGGAAWASVEANVDATASGAGIVRDTRDRFGWTVGGGGEYAFGGGWSAKAEYLYVRFDGQQYLNPPIPGFAIRDNVPLDNHIVRVGLNYKFGWGGPVVARY
jgi:outer membrane immunogenic protein